MNRELIKKWNEKVKPEDTVYVLGDVFWCGTRKAREIMKQLNGKKILIRGNHDLGSTRLLNLGFQEVYKELTYCFEGATALLSHYPYKPTKWEHFIHKLKNFWKFWRIHKYMRFYQRRPDNKGGWLIHGHVHRSWRVKGKAINVGVDVWNYYPVSKEQIEEIIEQVEMGKFKKEKKYGRQYFTKEEKKKAY